MSQAQRDKCIKQFREGKFVALVATDVAARGLDIPDVDLVVHFDLPNNSESFLHRSGRTGRAGKSGTTIAMYTDREARWFRQILTETKVRRSLSRVVKEYKGLLFQLPKDKLPCSGCALKCGKVSSR